MDFENAIEIIIRQLQDPTIELKDFSGFQRFIITTMAENITIDLIQKFSRPDADPTNIDLYPFDHETSTIVSAIIIRMFMDLDKLKSWYNDVDPNIIFATTTQHVLGKNND